jgi:two-component system CheB/CheR fusion protein
MSPTSLKQLVQQLAEERNVDFRGYKPSSLERRFRHRMFQVKIGDYESYAAYIREHPEEVNNLLNTVLINVTEFFRDPPVWEMLRKDIIPQLAEKMKPGDSLRAWTAGCASGEETYSLCILLAEHFGSNLKNYDVKVYTSDLDEEALNIARRGQYAADKLRHVREGWREKYFQGDKLVRVNRDVRRMAIFGRSNLASDPPISHIHLLLCRNVLIYFNNQLQKQILSRLHYALEPNGVLVLGKSESQLSHSDLFRPVSTKWRIFQRTTAERRDPRRAVVVCEEDDTVAKMRQEYSALKLYHETILGTLEPGILVLDTKDVIISENEAALRLLGLDNMRLMGKSLAETELPARCPELAARLQLSHTQPSNDQRVEFDLESEDVNRTLAITVKPINTPGGGRAGTLIYLEDITPRRKLNRTIEELETTATELQSANEELETTNEELQSTNEELETTNEELQALNEELGTTNEELEVRSREVDELSARYVETLQSLPWPAMLVAPDARVQLWNAAAEKVFGLGSKSVTGLTVKQLPISEKLRPIVERIYRGALVQGKPKKNLNVYVETGTYRGPVDMHAIPLTLDATAKGVLVIFQTFIGVATSAKAMRVHAVLTRRGQGRRRRR